jgi:hypothetical protein
MDERIHICFKQGTYYNPAWKHYNMITANVTCDRCKTSNLTISIGYGNTDLCMQCVSELDRMDKPYLYNPNMILTAMQQRFFNSTETPSYMQQKKFNSEKPILLKMRQSMYNK